MATRLHRLWIAGSRQVALSQRWCTPNEHPLGRSRGYDWHRQILSGDSAPYAARLATLPGRRFSGSMGFPRYSVPPQVIMTRACITPSDVQTALAVPKADLL